MDITKKTLETIEQAEVTPIPQWRFIAYGCGLWSASGVLLIFGSLSVASILYILTKNDWDIYSEIHESKLTHIISTLPFLWLALFALIVVFLYLDVKQTKNGYKYNTFMLIFITFAISVITGSGLYAAGFGEYIDNMIVHKAPQQAHMFNPRMKNLSHPEKGVLMGRVAIIDTISSTTTRIYIENPLLVGTWVLIVEEATQVPKRGIHINERIRALGEHLENTSEQKFLAHVILPFNTMNKEFRKNGVPQRPKSIQFHLQQSPVQ